MGVRLPAEVYARLEAHAAEHHITVSAFIRCVLDDAASEEICTWRTIGGVHCKFVAGRFIVGFASSGGIGSGATIECGGEAKP